MRSAAESKTEYQVRNIRMQLMEQGFPQHCTQFTSKLISWTAFCNRALA
jgi:hypothetical protein